MSMTGVLLVSAGSAIDAWIRPYVVPVASCNEDYCCFVDSKEYLDYVAGSVVIRANSLCNL